MTIFEADETITKEMREIGILIDMPAFIGDISQIRDNELPKIPSEHGDLRIVLATRGGGTCYEVVVERLGGTSDAMGVAPNEWEEVATLDYEVAKLVFLSLGAA